MSTLAKNINKAYLGDREVTQDSLYIGFEKVEILHKPTKIPFRKLGEYEVGDAVLWDHKKEMFRVIAPENLNYITNINAYTPTGVIVIPSSHDVYGTGEAGVMALKSVSLTTPNEGQTTTESLTWGFLPGSDLSNYGVVPVMGAMNGPIQPNITGTKLQGYIPAMRNDMSGNIICPHDTVTWYFNNSSSIYGYIPSPYLNDGSRNLDYSAIDLPSSSNNVLSDFQGKSTSEYLCSKATAQEDWKTASTIINSSSEGYYPAACACWRYTTAGLNCGDWYLPSCAELGYCVARFDQINSTISILQSYFRISLCQLGFTDYWTSSGGPYQNNRNVRTIMFNIGSVSSNSYYNNRPARPFTRLR